LSSFDFKEPGYPVYRGFIVPHRQHGDARRMTQDDISIFIDVLENMKTFVKACLKSRLGEGSGDEMSLDERLNHIADSIVLFLRIPLLREALPTIAPTPVKMLMIYHLLPKNVERVEWLDPYQDPYTFAVNFYSKVNKVKINDKTLTQYIRELEPFKILGDLALSEKIERCWFCLPADTRPGPNVSSLLAHQMLTSAISWALAVNDEHRRSAVDPLRVAELRLAAILHDLGKPFDYRNHIDRSVKIAEWLLGGLGEEVLPRSELEQLVDFIARHHESSETDEGRILAEADKIASSIDRVGELSKSVLAGELRDLSQKFRLDLGDAYRSGEPGWRFWSRLERERPGSIEELTRTFVVRLREMLGHFTKLPDFAEVGHPRRYDEIKLGLVDLGGIQNFITGFSDLRCVEAASLIVDCIVMAQVPLIIRRVFQDEGYWYPVEAILYAAGGIVEYLVPSAFSEKVKERLRRFGELVSKSLDLEVRVADTCLYDSYPHLKRELEEKMRAEKNMSVAGAVTLRIDSSSAGFQRSGLRLCRACYLRPEAREEAIPPGYCERCGKLYNLGTNIHFKIRYESPMKIRCGGEVREAVPEKSFGERWETVSEYVMELISGHDMQEVNVKRDGGDVEWRDLAVIKVDGNLMGAFMASAISIADAYERSIRIDLSLKRAFESGLAEIYGAVSSTGDGLENEAMKTVHSIYLGLLYMGGDDSLIVCPAWTAPALSAALGVEFSANMGECRGLGIGVAVGKCRANIWSLIDAANALVEEAKKVGRRNPSSSVICFDVAEGGELTGVSASARLRMLRRQLLTTQPYEASDFLKLLSDILYCEGDASIRVLAEKCYLLSRFEAVLPEGLRREKVEEVKRRAKTLLSAAGEVLARAYDAISRLPMGGDGDYLMPVMLKVAEIYAARQAARLGEREMTESERLMAEAFQKIHGILAGRNGGGVPYSDVERILKMAGGGAL